MRTRYAIISVQQAREVGLDPSTLRTTGEGDVIVTEMQVSGLSDVRLYTREEIISQISNANNSSNNSNSK